MNNNRFGTLRKSMMSYNMMPRTIVLATTSKHIRTMSSASKIQPLVEHQNRSLQIFTLTLISIEPSHRVNRSRFGRRQGSMMSSVGCIQPLFRYRLPNPRSNVPPEDLRSPLVSRPKIPRHSDRENQNKHLPDRSKQQIGVPLTPRWNY